MSYRLNWKTIWGNITTPAYNPDKNRDGGGYLQPFGGCLIELNDGGTVTVLLDDYSAGWFGGRYHIIVIRESKTVLDYWSGRDLPTKTLDNAIGLDFEELHGLTYEAVTFAALRSGYRRAEWTKPMNPFNKWSATSDDFLN